MSIESPKDVPEQWRPLFEKKGIEFSYRALERQIPGVSVNTIIRALTGNGRATARVAEAVSAALGVTPEKFWELRGSQKREPFALPPGADQLRQREREAVSELVRVMVRQAEYERNLQLTTRDFSSAVATFVRELSYVVKADEEGQLVGDAGFKMITRHVEPLLAAMNEYADSMKTTEARREAEGPGWAAPEEVQRYIERLERWADSLDGPGPNSSGAGDTSPFNIAARGEDDPKEDPELSE